MMPSVVMERASVQMLVTKQTPVALAASNSTTLRSVAAIPRQNLPVKTRLASRTSNFAMVQHNAQIRVMKERTLAVSRISKHTTT
jgi:hypothetical protein